MPVINPLNWAHLQFGDNTAWLDFAGSHALFHRAIDVQVRLLGGIAYNYLPIGDGGGDEAWLLEVQQAHAGAAGALLIAPPPDLSSYDLKDPDEFATWVYLLSLDDIRLRQAAGI